MTEIQLNLPTIIEALQSILIIFILVILVYRGRRINNLEKVLKIALGEVDIKINMKDYIYKHKDEILEEAVSPERSPVGLPTNEKKETEGDNNEKTLREDNWRNRH